MSIARVVQGFWFGELVYLGFGQQKIKFSMKKLWECEGLLLITIDYATKQMDIKGIFSPVVLCKITNR